MKKGGIVMAKSILHQIENGKHDVRVSTLQKILKAFNQQLNFTDT